MALASRVLSAFRMVGRLVGSYIVGFVRKLLDSFLGNRLIDSWCSPLCMCIIALMLLFCFRFVFLDFFFFFFFGGGLFYCGF